MQHATAVARGCAGVDAMVPLGPTEWIVEADEAVGRLSSLLALDACVAVWVGLGCGFPKGDTYHPYSLTQFLKYSTM